ncbi:MAG: Plug domain-containing protein, partial [Crocinitomicaceae bacterium]|nr:Plug domain-containing protein [Crocinitomicaceae bacterium]
MLRTGLVSFLFTLLSLLVVGQEFTVTGKIVSKSGKGTEFATVRSPQSKVKVVYTDLNGQFSIPIEANDSFQLYINLDTANIIERYAVSPNIGKLMNIGVIKINVQELVAVNAESTKQNVFGIETVNIPDLDLIPMGNLEKLLVLTTAATSNNELTSNYNVRGGSYDENLVYVNGFLIYRPFLTRSGQQEGMSFINTALVEDVSFSAGGFDAKYGDKLSSVLDIKYRDPIKFRASGVGSLLGVQAHVEQSVNSRFSYMVGLRYRANGYLLNALPAKGAYNPVFMDGQFVTKYAITEKWRWEVLGHFSSNDYRFAPQTQKTDFGTVNEAYSFNIYYEGQERTRFLTAMAGTALKYEPDKKTNLDFYATVFRSVEREYFDILGQYFINELETDPSKETFGDSVNVLGIGSFLNHARNKLDATIYNVYH